MMLDDNDDVWIPTLWDVEAKKPHEYWSQFGFEQLIIPDDCQEVINRKDTLKTLFDERYALRMLNKETMESWQLSLQSRLDKVVHHYNRAYELYDKYKTDMDSVIDGSHTMTTIEDTGRSIDTPDTDINADHRYADSVSSNKTVSDSTTSLKGVDVTIAVNASINGWVDIDDSFISEFENNFLNVFWY